jgi:hypothetical protein
MMRAALLALLLILPLPALAAGGGHYVNVRYGYAIDVPAGFVGQGESDNSDGQVFRTPTATLTVYGGNILDGDFESEARQRQGSAASEGWGISYQVSTPSNASYSGKRGGRVLYARLIALCGGSQFAAFELEYSKADISKFDTVVGALVRSLRATDGSASCN